MDTDQTIIERFIELHTPEAVGILEKSSYSQIAAFIQNTSPEITLKIISHMNSYRAAKCIELIDFDLALALLEKLEFQLLELIIRQTDKKFRHKVLKKISPELGQKIRQKLQFSTNTVGAFMKLKVFTIPQQITIREAEIMLKKERKLVSPEIYITDKTGKLSGILKLHQLIMADEHDPVYTVMETKTPKFMADEPIQSVINHLFWLDYKAIPVVDAAGILIGSLHLEDIKKTSLRRDHEFNQQIIETGSALGELYRIGLTALLQSTGKFD
ncbi:MAG: CBS domain-containing protein [Candidatus Cyclobacteriaceae bacterium M3_2C_046]